VQNQKAVQFHLCVICLHSNSLNTSHSYALTLDFAYLTWETRNTETVCIAQNSNCSINRPADIWLNF